MNVGVSYALKEKQVWLEIQVPDGSTVNDVIQASGILDIFTDIDLSTQKVGIFGKVAKLNAAVNDGDRVEIYRAITATLDDDDDDDDDD